MIRAAIPTISGLVLLMCVSFSLADELSPWDASDTSLSAEHFHIRQQAASLDELLAKTKPRFVCEAPDTPCARDLIWIMHDGAGKPVFSMNRAYSLQFGKKDPPQIFLLEADLEASCDFLEYARYVDEKPVIVTRDPKRGVVYRAHWPRLSEGRGRYDIDRVLYFLCDVEHRWRFIGEGPQETNDRSNVDHGQTSAIEQTVRWTDDPAAPVEIHCVERTIHGPVILAEDDPGPPELEVRHNCTLSGKLPATTRSEQDVYVAIDKDEAFDALARRIAMWQTSFLYDSNSSRRNAIVAAVSRMLRESNPGISAIVRAGTIVRFQPDMGRIADARVSKS